MLTTLFFRLQKASVDGLEDDLLFLGQRNNPGEFESVFGVTEINFVHRAQLQQGAFGRELRVPQAILKQGQEQVSQIADEDVGMHMLGEPMADGPQLRNAFEASECFFDYVLVEVE